MGKYYLFVTEGENRGSKMLKSYPGYLWHLESEGSEINPDVPYQILGS